MCIPKKPSNQSPDNVCTCLPCSLPLTRTLLTVFEVHACRLAFHLLSWQCTEYMLSIYSPGNFRHMCFNIVAFHWRSWQCTCFTSIFFPENLPASMSSFYLLSWQFTGPVPSILPPTLLTFKLSYYHSSSTFLAFSCSSSSFYSTGNVSNFIPSAYALLWQLIQVPFRVVSVQGEIMPSLPRSYFSDSQFKYHSALTQSKEKSFPSDSLKA